MPVDLLRVCAYCAYIASWFVLLVVAALGSIPRLACVGETMTVRPSVAIGTVLQALSVAAITFTLPAGPLHPRRAELAGVLLLSPLAAMLLAWVYRSTPRHGEHSLVTAGAYRWMRHPMYAALFAMLLATGFLASSGVPLAMGILCFIVGSELRISVEEADLAEKFPAEFRDYKLRTRWRYIPGLR